MIMIDYLFGSVFLCVAVFFLLIDPKYFENILTLSMSYVSWVKCDLKFSQHLQNDPDNLKKILISKYFKFQIEVEKSSIFSPA